MGQSTDAILAYGINIEEGSAAHDVCNLLQDERYDEHREAEKELGVTAIGHCSCDYRMYIVGVEHMRAWRGRPKEVDPAGILLDEKEARAKVQAFCERFGIPFDESACKWWLASDWC